MEVQLHAFLTSAVDGSEWSASRPGRFTLRERTPDTHWIGGYVGPRAGLDAVVRRKIPSPYRNSNPSVNITNFSFLNQISGCCFVFPSEPIFEYAVPYVKDTIFGIVLTYFCQKWD
jgi:hypothetical protein